MISTTQHTLGHIDCPACAALGSMQTVDLGQCFSLAADIWLEHHRAYVRPQTWRAYRQYGNRLCELFGAIRLKDIHIGHVRQFQIERGQKACATRVNLEINCVFVPVMKEANQWRRLEDVYHPLPVVQKQVRQTMTAEEERRLMAVALDADKPQRLVAGHCLLVMCNTGMGFGELRHLRRGDVFLDEQKPFITVNPEGCKNEFRIRTIPLNWIALRSMRWILHRWEELGGDKPDQYILPLRSRHAVPYSKTTTPPQFYHPMESITQSARRILDEAGLNGLVPYDMRSHLGTKLMEDPNVSDQMFRSLFGHSDTITRRRYYRSNLEKKTVAMEKCAVDPSQEKRLIAFPGGGRK